ncbi:MAG: toprim domain-containing protein [Sodaliphilus pleomorphus]|jgi:topoisomerase-4 subunit B|uniref:toprim domain-containing protein n=1 Tax=Sodaliphilus pleomorphus TaxID=2606626 RepID=UPI0024095FC3|nr:toprim domain-containing protein [Sodaliphilus pleomorphus]MCI6169914.1 toprim domain-containing protein [Muribaculaceae bacterium]MDD6476114.1 toprim domain-containing protein [Sodaliphilus pleomorphus]MDD6686944.1 toprim domain-containing protein [Sodaliphilus pleomorphus]MDY6259261.1 toprim domain-containing protein [Bacteroidales bacterium]
MEEKLELNQNKEGIEQPSDFGGYDKLVTLTPREHIRLRPGMYIGKLGDGSQSDDGIYVLMKEVIDNSIDEYNTGFAKPLIEIDVADGTVTIRDYGRGIPLDQVRDASSKMNTGAKYDSKNYKRSVGLNGVGIKAVNALSSYFYIRSVRDGQSAAVTYSEGLVESETGIVDAGPDEENGTLVKFTPDNTIFKNYEFHDDIVEAMVKNYSFLNTGLTLVYNGKRYHSRNGLLDLVKENMTNDPLYKPMYFKGDDIEVVITHAAQVGEEFYSFVNGQHTTQGGTHQTAFREALSRTIKEFYGKNFEYSDIRNGIVAAIAIKVEEPVFESQTKIKLGSSVMWKDGPTIYKFINDFIKKQLDDYLHKDADTAEVLLKKIQESERERKAIAGVTKQARERAKKVALNNSKLRDCRVHFNDARAPKDNDRREESSIFITEGLSASGSITKIRDVETQAVFSLRGKPLNTFGLQPAQVVQNEEFSLLQAALNIEDSIDNLRYNKVIVATDADVDGMHIRLLLLTYFLQFHPELIKTGHLYILQTPLFRVRNRKEAKRKSRAAGREAKLIKPETYYCYTDEERVRAINKLGDNAEITRFKGLGEISPDEFADFIGPDMRLDRVQLRKEDAVNKMLEFFMGKNTMERQEFIVDNLVIEDDEDITVH